MDFDFVVVSPEMARVHLELVPADRIDREEIFHDGLFDPLWHVLHEMDFFFDARFQIVHAEPVGAVQWELLGPGDPVFRVNQKEISVVRQPCAAIAHFEIRNRLFKNCKSGLIQNMAHSTIFNQVFKN